jgi:tRNA pseudouridine38-40 synthase
VLNFSLEIPADEPINFEQLATSVSALLRGEVAVLLADEMPPMFHARSSAQSKQYSYRMVQRHLPLVLDKGRVWAVERSLDVTRMKNEASHLVGEHDLSSFRATDCASTNPVREILESELVEEPPYLIYRVVGRGFLKQMVRSIVGTLVQLGAGKLGDKTMSDILRARDRRAAGLTAPAQGLYLDWVGYPEPYKIPNEILLFGSGRRDKMQDDLVQEVPK